MTLFMDWNITMTDDGFDLISERWILARHLDGRVEQLSILDTFASAHELAGVVGEIPTQTFAITRLLLAILHRAVGGPADDDQWAELWQRPELPVEQVRSYLAEYRDRFDLLHPSQPFFQVADLHTAKDETFGLERLIADAPTGRPYFTTRLGASLSSIELAEAARWLVHCQAFDPSGIKSGAVGDSRVISGRGYPIGVAWSGLIGGILCEGPTLRETLLLNLIARDFDEDSFTEADQPVWERPPQTAQEEVPGGRPVSGPPDLYTWQARRIRLATKGNRVTGVLICNGDKLEPRNLHRLEPMTVWRRSANQEKLRGLSLVYMPRQHDPERSLWRGIAALLPSQASRKQYREGALQLAPASLHWLGHLQYYGLLPKDYVVRTRALGMQYINQSALVGEIIDDSLTMNVIVLSEASQDLGEQIATGAAAIETGVRALADLASNLAVAAGGESEPPRAAVRAAGFAAVDQEFRRWLAELGPATDPLPARAQLNELARKALLELGRQLLASASPQAWTGRTANKRLVCTPLADSWFRREIYSLFPIDQTTDIDSRGVSA